MEGFLGDEERVVRESCKVALDMIAHERSGEFQYATLLVVLSPVTADL